MRRIDATRLSYKYRVRLLTEDDMSEIYELCRSNPQYYRSHSLKLSRELVAEDMTILPPDKTAEDKYFLGWFDDDRTLAAVIDLIDGYASGDIAYIGFFMVAAERSGRGEGTEIMTELCGKLAQTGFSSVRLAYGKHNPQAEHFWKKNGFEAIKETDHEKYGSVIVAERKL